MRSGLLKAVTKLGKAGGEMARYDLDSILNQDIPDDLLMDIAYHWQANDNRVLEALPTAPDPDQPVLEWLDCPVPVEDRKTMALTIC
ncbi:hypothetical protein JL100_013100 [Skermanella mucosa]|uniref:hypothetical protein n=1 Tax=Skermanella mucosa TaxID=1789672 RepID=UPI00192BB69F|nr:hypothetical protein [Skermanella mucosa]UEM23627.1 hypothetical protein JL100_013100 [Skermanella mucosa]